MVPVDESRRANHRLGEELVATLSSTPILNRPLWSHLHQEDCLTGRLNRISESVAAMWVAHCMFEHARRPGGLCPDLGLNQPIHPQCRHTVPLEPHTMSLGRPRGFGTLVDSSLVIPRLASRFHFRTSSCRDGDPHHVQSPVRRPSHAEQSRELHLDCKMGITSTVAGPLEHEEVSPIDRARSSCFIEKFQPYRPAAVTSSPPMMPHWGS